MSRIKHEGEEKKKKSFDPDRTLYEVSSMSVMNCVTFYAAMTFVFDISCAIVQKEWREKYINLSVIQYLS